MNQYEVQAESDGPGTWTAEGLSARQPLMLRRVSWRRCAATAAGEASVRRRQQCSPSDLSPLHFVARAVMPVSPTCKMFSSLI